MSQCIPPRFSRILSRILPVILLSAIPACTAPEHGASNNNTQKQIRLSLGNASIEAELALDNPTRVRGLMHRESMPADHGMLFVFDQPSRQSFWMKNTHIPLDIGYFNPSGELLEIHPLHPHNLDSVKSLSSEIQFALEVNRGWFRNNHITPGAELDLDALRRSLRSMGVDPAF